MKRIFGRRQENQDANAVKRFVILDERVLVISTFELNKIASLTYNEIVCDDLFEVMEQILAGPLRHTPLALVKALVIMRHCLVYGSEKCVNSVYGVSKFVEGLQEYNTVLIAQQRQGPGGLISRIKGGGVDRGEPVRDAAKKIGILLANINDLQRIRNENASKDSLVPVGNNKVGFITDEVRLLILQKRIEKQNQINLKSNLTKAEGGFGGGYNSTDGKQVVGAANGIEEMMKMAKKRKKKFSDEGTTEEPEEERILRDLMEEANRAKKERERALKKAEEERKAAAAPSGDVDLLDFGGTVTTTSPTVGTANLLGGDGTGVDLLGTAPVAAAAAPKPALVDPFTPVQQPSESPLNDLLAMATGQPSRAPATRNNDPFGNMVLGVTSTSSTPAPADSSLPAISISSDNTHLASNPPVPQDAVGNLGMTMQSMNLKEDASKQSTSYIMSPSEDRFAALDALAERDTAKKASPLDSQNAENRILGFDSAIQHSTSEVQPAPAFTVQPPITDAASGSIATKDGDGENHDDDGDNPWVMGGGAGSGLNPVAPAPGAPPPPAGSGLQPVAPAPGAPPPPPPPPE